MSDSPHGSLASFKSGSHHSELFPDAIVDQVFDEMHSNVTAHDQFRYAELVKLCLNSIVQHLIIMRQPALIDISHLASHSPFILETSLDITLHEHVKKSGMNGKFVIQSRDKNEVVRRLLLGNAAVYRAELVLHEWQQMGIREVMDFGLLDPGQG